MELLESRGQAGSREVPSRRGGAGYHLQAGIHQNVKMEVRGPVLGWKCSQKSRRDGASSCPGADRKAFGQQHGCKLTVQIFMSIHAVQGLS